MFSTQNRGENHSSWNVGVTVVLRSSSCPYLWIRLRCDAAGYMSGIAYPSICRISWVYCSLLKNARDQLRARISPRSSREEQTEEEQAEE